MAIYRGYECCDDQLMGWFRPIRFEDNGVAAWQVTGDAGELVGILWPNGVLDSPNAGGNRTWELCEESREHTRLLQSASAEWRGDDRIRFEPV